MMPAILLLLSSLFTLVELNCENLFDTRHDSLKQDEEFLPTSAHRWTPYRYWRKLNRVGQEILACGQLDSAEVLPDLVALVEVENDTVLTDLTRRSLLRRAGYAYVMTDGPDPRGIDVALLYSPFTFRLLRHRSIRVGPLPGFRPTRDMLYAAGELASGDTLHVFVVHAPSRAGGERFSRPYRLHVAQVLAVAVDSVRLASPGARIVVAGDFNDYAADVALQRLAVGGLCDVSATARGTHGALGTYRYQGRWGSLDHILCDSLSASRLRSCRVFDAPFLLAEDKKYGGVMPRRNYLGPRYLDGFSDHLPLVAVWEW
ncbi:putative extracellular nuclease [Prevotella dentalis DSM 3688]|nr:putative extracellular nuclease [Prevotella dentalis DSM 3688]